MKHINKIIVYCIGLLVLMSGSLVIASETQVYNEKYANNSETNLMMQESTMSVGDYTVNPGDTDIIIIIYGVWNTTISGYSIGFQYPHEIMTIVEVTNVGTIGEDAFIFQYSEEGPGLLSIGAAWFPGNYKPPGSGILAIIIIDIDGNAESGDYPLDLGVFGGNPPVDCAYSDEFSSSITPDLTDGTLTVIDYICGDVNWYPGIPPPYTIDISDLVYMVSYMFQGGPSPYMECLMDVNCDCSVDISDLVYLVSYMFQGGPPPCDYCCTNPACPWPWD